MNSKDYHKILTEIYKEYNPDKINEIPTLLDKYKRQEEALLQSIIKKYKVSANDVLRLTQQEMKAKNVNEVPYVPHSDTLPSYTDSKPSRHYRKLWITVAIVIITAIIAWFFKPQKETLKKSVETYPSLVLEDLRQLRKHPDQTSTIERKGYVLLSAKENSRTFLGTHLDTVIIEVKWMDNITRVSWSSGVNRKWLYNHMRDEMKRMYTHLDMLSNTDESDNKIDGLPYYVDECYLDSNNICYKVYVNYHKGKTLGYEISINSLENKGAAINSKLDNVSKHDEKSIDNSKKNTKQITVEEYRYALVEWSDSRVQYEYNNALVYITKNADNLTPYEVEMWKALSEEAHRRHLSTL